MRTFSIQTLGCKVNQYESEQMAELLRSRGWTESDAASADLAIVNTCSVTMEAASKSRQMVRRAVGARRATGGTPQTAKPAFGSEAQARREAQHMVLVAGCWATSDKEEAAKMAGVGGVITHHDDVAERLGELAGFGESSRVSLPLLTQRQPQQRAVLKIQDGCDAHCTYCIIPKLRPKLWSKPIEELVTEAKQLVDAGHVEIVLTGVFLGAYGHETALRRRRTKERDLAPSDSTVKPPPPLPSPGVPGEGVKAGARLTGRPGLADAIEALCAEVRGLRRVRLSSLEPGDVDEHLLGVLKSHEQVVPHFHLPLQSGSDALLRRMNRQYSRDDFLRLVDRIYAAFDRPALTTDIIVAFPGETEAAFEETVDVVRRSRFIHIHAFPYSPRPGTAAARWREKYVPPAVADERMDVLRAMGDEFSLEYRSTFVGQSVELLVERMKAGGGGCAAPPASQVAEYRPSPSAVGCAAPPALQEAVYRPSPSGLRHGRCERYFDVHFESDSVAAGDLVEVKIDRVTRARTFATKMAVVASGAERRSS
jgi:threonylcarbamoyladenosine tRNA methylthiotransferase MtaB